ncbi:lecithin retinol acyltransferase family protein [Ralstonia syzygii]|uniref:lecithin retinol acyltransferase family protein n=1 Tax=Ralstonia syzygii TaxID=28097 RepID=UPI0036F1EDA1
MTNVAIRAGDHLWVWCTGYTHHGIASGRNTVIHYLGKKGLYEDGMIAETTLGQFAEGGEIHVKDHPDRRHGSVDSVQRARQRIGETEYNLVFNNCEHFVTWCIEDEHTSEQVNTVFRTAGQAAAAVYASRAYGAWATAQQGDTIYRTASYARTAASAVNAASSATATTGSTAAVVAGLTSGVGLEVRPQA